MNWEEHINKIKVKSKIALNTIKEVADQNMGRRLKGIKKTVYGNLLVQTGLWLESIHMEGIIIFTGAFKTSPVEAVNVEVDDLSLKL